MPDAGTTSFTDDTATFGADHTYRVMARSALGTGPAAEVSVSVPTPPVQPATGLTETIADPFDGNVTLAWNVPTEGPVIVG